MTTKSYNHKASPLDQSITKASDSTGTGTIFYIWIDILIHIVQAQGGGEMKLNSAVSKRLQDLLTEKGMTQYQLFMKSGVPKSTIGNVINCSYSSVKLRIIHEICQGLEISISDFFASSYFDENNLED